MVGMDIPRNLYYKKELELKLSMAYGPGRHDPTYEELGIDYPFAYVRWTEQRNFGAFLDLVEEGKVTPKKLITHQFDFDDSLKAYDLLEGKSKEKYLGIVLTYGEAQRAESKGHSEKRSTIILKTTPCAKRRAPDAPVIGLIGAGNFTRSVILPTLKKVGGFELAGLCTATGLSAHTTGKKHGFEFITTDNEQIFNNKEINTVFITTRHNTHAEYVINALKAGKHVYVEKPLCLNEEELKEIIDIYSSLITHHSSPPLLMVGFNRRFSLLIQKMKEIVTDTPMSIIYRINAGFIPRDSWIQDKEVGGGRIIGEVCHFIDTCSFLTGSLPSSVFANCVKKDDKSIPDEDNVSILLTFESGSSAIINYTAYGNKQMPKESIELFANNITMQMNNYRELIVYRGSKKERIANSNQDKGFVNEFEAFKQAIKTGTPAISFESIYKTTMTTFKILESLRSNAVITV